MPHDTSSLGFLPLALILIGAAVVAVPLAKRLGLGSILGYLVAGVLIGPQVGRVFDDISLVTQVAELGIVLFLFLVGLDLNPKRVWQMRRDIFGLGGVQVLATGAVLMWVPMAFGRDFNASLIAGLGLAITSTAILMQVLADKNEVQSEHGQRAFAVSIFQDLTIVPLLALVAFLSPLPREAGEAWYWQGAKIVAAVGFVVLVGRFLLNPMFRILAQWGAREIMTAAALGVVIGAAYVMTLAGLSMAMGAFLAGVFLAESNFRHQLEADVEPFRGLLMGLFFISVGMTVDLSVVAASWWRLAIALVLLVLLKALVMYAVMRLFRFDHAQSVRVALLIAQAGEFGFVLYAAAVQAGVMQPDHGSVLVALVVLSMAVSPFLYRLVPLLAPQKQEARPDEDFSDAKGSVLMIGFGRFGQVAAQCLLTQGCEVTIIDNDAEMIQSAGTFGFKVYFGDGTRLDVLRAAGLGRATIVCVCIDDQQAATRIVEIVREAARDVKLYVRAWDRAHALELEGREVDYQIRETFESALTFGARTLEALGQTADEAAAVADDVRKRDIERFAQQKAEGIYAGLDKLVTQIPPKPVPTPLAPPAHRGRALNPEAEDALRSETEFSS